MYFPPSWLATTYVEIQPAVRHMTEAIEIYNAIDFLMANYIFLIMKNTRYNGTMVFTQVDVEAGVPDFSSAGIVSGSE